MHPAGSGARQCSEAHAAARSSQQSSKRLERWAQRRPLIALAPSTVQNIRGRFRPRRPRPPRPPPRHARRGCLTAFLHGRSEGHPRGRGILSARMQRVPWCRGRGRARAESGLGSRSQEGLGREIVLRSQERYSGKRFASVSAFEVQNLAGRQPPVHAGQSNCRRPPRPHAEGDVFISPSGIDINVFRRVDSGARHPRVGLDDSRLISTCL